MSEASLIAISASFLVTLNVAYALELLQLSRNKFWRYLGHQEQCRNRKIHSESGFPILLIISSAGYFSSTPLIKVIVTGVVSIANLLQFANQRYGHEGSDHIRIYSNLIYFISSILRYYDLQYASQFYLAATGALGGAFYFGAGLAKCGNLEWWSGLALRKSFSTSLYGNVLVSKFLRLNYRMTACISSVICLWELSFVLAMHCAEPVAYLWMLMGIAFHISVAILMRLPLFVPAAMSLYPGVFWVNQYFQSGA